MRTDVCAGMVGAAVGDAVRRHSDANGSAGNAHSGAYARSNKLEIATQHAGRESKVTHVDTHLHA